MLHKIIMIIMLVMLSGIAIVPAHAQDTNYCDEPLDMIPGQIVFSRPGIFFRTEPNISGGQINYYPDSITFRVLEGPVCSDNQLWWRVRNYEAEGWLSQGQDMQMLFPGDRPGPQCVAPQGFAPGQAVAFLNGVRLRAEPSLNGQVLTTAETGENAVIIGGSVCADDINWWQVRFTLGGVPTEGWAAEGQGDDLYLILIPAVPPTPQPGPCAPPYRRLGIGVRAVITYLDDDPKNLRAEPDRDAPIITHLLEEVAVDIIGGSVCADGLNWWQVQVVGRPDVVGWIAEGGTAARGYWLRPIEFVDDGY